MAGAPGLTPSQTIGPFFSHALPWPDGPYVVPADDPAGFWLRGRVLDGAGEPVPDALVESWQVGPPGCRGFGRSPTDDAGRYAIRTAKPGPLLGGPLPGGPLPGAPQARSGPRSAPDGASQAPHLDLSIFARGLLHRVVTRVYFPDEAAANAADPMLASLPGPRRTTLVARPAADGYELDIRLQGADPQDDSETVFFEVERVPTMSDGTYDV